MINVPRTTAIRRTRPRGSGGFTLLEVLLTTVLTGVLLATLWGLFHAYRRLFETGHVKTEQAQLVRTLFQQLTDDLHGAIEDSPSRDPSFGRPETGSVRRFGLLGTARTLRIDVLEMIPPEESPDPDADVGEAYRDEPLRQVPELRTVLYTFEDPKQWQTAGEDPIRWSLDGPDSLNMATDDRGGVSEESRPVVRPGLTRRELDFETPYVAQDKRQSGGLLVGSLGGSVAGSPGDVLDELSPDALRADDLDDESITWVPEVVGLQFRYFDGSSWSGEWNSLQRKSLPVAVEVTIEVSSSEPIGPAAAGTAQAEREDVELDFEPALEDVEDAQPVGLSLPAARRRPKVVQRLVIDVPSAKKHGTVRRPEPVTAIRRATAPRPLAAPKPITPRPIGVPTMGTAPAGARRPDQWMRTEQP